MNHRTHRKVMIVDEQVGFTGGVGIADEWQGDARDETEWRDTHFRIEGPAVDVRAAGYRVHLANPAAMKQYEGIKHRGDESDAQYLAHVLRLGILPTGYICPPAERAVRDLARKRLQLVRTRNAQVVSVESNLARQRGSRLSSNAVKRMTVADADKLGLPEDVTAAMAANVAVIQTLNVEIAGQSGMQRRRADWQSR